MPLLEVTAADLKDLIERGVEEALFVEYKSQWDRFKIPRAVASFANMHGGTLIVGIDAPKRIPTKLTPIKDDGGLEDRMIQAIRSNIDPVPAFTPQVVKVARSTACVLVEVPEGTQPPYLLTSNGQIYVRAGSMSEPIPANDRETIDRLFAKGRRGLDWANDAIQRLPHELTLELGAKGWEEEHIVTVPAVADGLSVAAKIFSRPFVQAICTELPKGLAVFQGMTPPVPSMRDGLSLEWEAANGGTLRFRASTTGSLLTSWEGNGSGYGWLDSLITHAFPIHGRLLVEQLGHRGTVGVAAYRAEAVPGPHSVRPSQVASSIPVPVTDLSEPSFLDSLKRSVTRFQGYLAYED